MPSVSTREKVIFLFPALNEEEGITATIQGIPIKEMEKRGYECEVVVIDGGSTDKTVELGRKAGAQVIISPCKGYGFQYKYGLARIEGDYVITGDADGTYPFNEAPRFMSVLHKGKFDFITTNRFADLKKDSMSFMHFVGNRILTLTGNILFGMRLKDNQSGMWCFKLEKIRSLGLTDDNMAFSEEIKIKAFKKFRSIELPISYRPRLGKSKLNYGHAVKNMVFLFKLRFGMFR